MRKREYSGSELICAALGGLGAKHVFGLPGTQNVELFEGLRRSSLRTVLATTEGAAGFMANGYFRGSGQPGVFATISGPGFTNAITALAEARQDSAAVLHLVNAPPEGNKKFRLQHLHQREIVASVVKEVIDVESAGECVAAIRHGWQCALQGEPGPVMMQLSRGALQGSLELADADRIFEERLPPARGPQSHQVEHLIELLLGAQRPVFYVGQGSLSAGAELQALVETLHAPVITTRSGRGVLPMDHPLALAFDYNGTGAEGCNEVLNSADLVVVLGCKLGHNGTAGFRIALPAESMVQVDTSDEVLAGNYPAHLQIRSDVRLVLEALAKCQSSFRRSRWSEAELSRWKPASSQEWGQGPVEPDFPTMPGCSAKGFFDLLRSALPRDACLVTDSGLHQVLAFRHWKAQAPRTLIAPSDFQSMGFGLPAAIGAKLATPDRPVVALTGDGGAAMSGMELLTAARENIDLLVFVFNDGALGQIRLQQFGSYGAAHATLLSNPDFELFAQAVGAAYFYLEGDVENKIGEAARQPGVRLVEVPLGDSQAMRVSRMKGIVRRAGNDLVGRSTWSKLKAKLKAGK